MQKIQPLFKTGRLGTGVSRVSREVCCGAGSQANEALRGSGFSHPKRNPLGSGLAAQPPIMCLDQGIDHRPVFLALGFLRLDEVFDGKEFEGLSGEVSDRRPPLPKHFKSRQVAPSTEHRPPTTDHRPPTTAPPSPPCNYVAAHGLLHREIAS
jgi:hypothetical protein